MMNNGELMAESLCKESKIPNNNVNAVTDQERELAREAQVEYLKADFSTCSNLLGKLELLRPQDLKITHNKIIVDYYKSNDYRRTEILKKSLKAIALATVTIVSQTQEADDIEKSVLRYNQAVILYHSRQYLAALEIINSLFALIEPMEESFVHKICLLLIELHLILEKPDTALTLVNYIEGQFTSTAESSKSALGEQNQNQKHDGIIKSSARTTAIEKEPKKDSIDVATDAFRIKLLKYKLRIYLRTLQLKLCKREWKTLVSLGMPTNLSTIFLKANLEYLRKNFKKALKLLNTINKETCPDFKTCGECIAVLYYNNIASLHFALGKPNLACFYLKSALEENKKVVDSIRTESTNNLIADLSRSPPPLHALEKNKHYELMYSLGVSFLYTGQATKAFDYFIEAAQQLHNNPRLWLRMAECCIICHKPSNKVDFDICGRRKDIVEKIIGENNGSSISKKFILAATLSKNCKYNSEGISYAIPQPTLEYGMLCLKNAFFLLPTTNCEEMNLPINNLPTEEGVKKTIIGHQQQTSLLGSLTPSSHKLGNNTNATGHVNSTQNSTRTIPSQSTIVENLNLKISILTASAYISLCLGDYLLALEYAKSLLSIKKLPGAHLLLGNLYAAESLIFLDRIYEALEHLKPENLQDINTYIPIGEVVGDKEKIIEEIIEQKPSRISWYPLNIATAKSILRYNLAVAYAIRGELDKSGEILKQVWTSKGPDCDVPIHIIMLALYIELQLGHVDIARSLIKQHYYPVQQ
ncbi:PREDICTED: CCR4-NOT transcription complex subunit 10-B [Ceratosolen solmsi marchali]|uniref:CCR4-NOT transcription complex subunit 10 n=1 Tax=Ceratosolen solmsi marchali TaxID=326594 RepID=A0AAJ6YBG9_9HYME|nr:PREDICTED: CCR4-NOT transcription complex subunit 10-B [Ceratosolen solmsi marchali]